MMATQTTIRVLTTDVAFSDNSTKCSLINYKHYTHTHITLSFIRSPTYILTDTNKAQVRKHTHTLKYAEMTAVKKNEQKT